MSSLHAAWLDPNRRLHLSHGPVDLIVKAEGEGSEIAFAQAIMAMEGMLEKIVEHLPLLRQSSMGDPCTCSLSAHPVVERMVAATGGYGHRFITPMAAVAGAVADYILEAMLTADDLLKVSVNNGGDVAFWLGEGASTTAMLADFGASNLTIPHDCPWRGMATSGHGGRSHSLGIADAAFVLAKDAATADAAATMIANAVDLPLEHPEARAIRRKPASTLNPDSDLASRLVTVSVGRLSDAAIELALDAGEIEAANLMAVKPIAGAIIRVKNSVRIVGFETGFPEFAAS